MKYKEWMKLIRKHPHKDLNGKYVAYDSDATALGEITYENGRVISRKLYRRRHGNGNCSTKRNPFKRW